MAAPRQLAFYADRIDRFNTAIGRTAAWLVLAVVLIECTVIMIRHVFGVGSIWLQEAAIYGHAALFMLAAAWTLQADRHVRVDVFYSEASPRRKALVDLLGAVFLLLPFMLLILTFSLPYVARSLAVLERSRETSGLPFVYLLKMLIPAFALLLGLQGIAQAIRAWAVLAETRADA